MSPGRPIPLLRRPVRRARPLHAGAILGAAILTSAPLAAQERDTARPEAGPLEGAVELALAPAEVIRVVERPDVSGIAVRELPSPLTREEILLLQTALAGAGHDPGTRSGALDRGTAGALLAYQRRAGLAPCGCPTYETVAALGLPALFVVRLSWAEPPAPEPRPRSAAAAGAEGEASPGEQVWYGFPVLLHRRVEFDPPEDGAGGDAPDPTPGAAPPPRGPAPPGVRPPFPSDPRGIPRGR